MLTSCKILNRDQIKLLAIITMTFNHISHVLMTPGSVLAEVFEDIGYFTAMTMCFFLAEGYRYTRSKKAYAQRLFVFALISQIPYVLAVGFFQLNVLFTLLACFLIFCVMDSSLSKLQKKLLLAGLVLFTVVCDWAVILHGFYATFGIIASAVATLILYNGKKSARQTPLAKWSFYIYYPAHLLILWAIGQVL